MASFSSRSPSKAFLFLVITLLVAASFNLPVIFNEQFLEIKNSIEKRSSAVLDRDVRIGDIGFLPYGELILSDIETQGIRIKRLNIRFNIPELLINKKRRGIRLSGAAVFKKPDFIGQVKYRLDAIITPDVISIGSLYLDFAKFSLEIKGNINDYRARPSAQLSIASREIIVPGIAKINNLYGTVRLSRDWLSVKNLDFFVNDFPLGIRCRVSNFKSPLIRLNVMSYPDQMPSLRPFNPMNFELDFSGRKSGNSVNGDLTLTTQKLISINPRETYNTMARMDGLSCVFSNKVISLMVKNILCKTTVSGKERLLGASDFKTLAYFGKARVYLAGLSVSAYKGLIKGNGFLDFNQWPVKLLLDFKAYKLNVTELAGALGLNYDLRAGLDFRGVFNNRQDPCLSGRVDASDGYLKNAQVLGLISDFLSVPSLKNVYFKGISSLVSFSFANKEAVFDKITVAGQDMALIGNIRLKNTGKINGGISVRLSTRLLKESFKLRLLFLLIGEKLGYQDFEFEIGGSVNSPQIKWLSTRFRENIMKYLGEGGRKAVEKSLEQAIDHLTRPD